MKFNEKLPISLFVIWSLAIAAGVVWLTDYATRPGHPAHAPSKIPSSILKNRKQNLPMLLVVAHPYCPCSRATIRELNHLVSSTAGLADVKVLFFQPSDRPREWVESDLWREASVISGVTVSAATEDEFKALGAATSGQVFLYDAAGNLVFSGGITNARGHEGSSNGRAAIEQYLRGGSLFASQTPVFGCALNSHSDTEVSL
jgi:hypothetical protein